MLTAEASSCAGALVACARPPPLSVGSSPRRAQRKEARQIHFYMILGGAIWACAGVGAMMLNKYLAGRPHFTSPHSLLAIGEMVLFAAVASGGALLYTSLGRRLARLVTHDPVRITRLLQSLASRHAALGLVVVLVSHATMFSGLGWLKSDEPLGSMRSIASIAVVINALVTVGAAYMLGRRAQPAPVAAPAPQ